jgi:hypothetical protein
MTDQHVLEKIPLRWTFLPVLYLNFDPAFDDGCYDVDELGVKVVNVLKGFEV